MDVFPVQDNYLDDRFTVVSGAPGHVTRSESLQGEGHNPNALGNPGVEKSSISSLKMIPVSESSICDPKTKLIVEVNATAIPFLSTTEVWA